MLEFVAVKVPEDFRQGISCSALAVCLSVSSADPAYRIELTGKRGLPPSKNSRIEKKLKGRALAVGDEWPEGWGLQKIDPVDV